MMVKQGHDISIHMQEPERAHTEWWERAFWNSKTSHQWHTSSNKATSPNPLQTILSNWNQVFKHQPKGKTFSFKPTYSPP